MNNTVVYCLKYAESFLPESMVFDGGDTKKQIPISFVIYLIKNEEKNILIDAGCVTMPGFDMRNFKSPVSVLNENGLDAKDITDVVITHAHHDHIEAVKFFDKATIHISSAEYENAKSYIPENFKVSTFDDEFFLSPQIKVLIWGGHSKGSSIVELKTDDKIHVLAGDECYTNTNVEKQLCTGTIFGSKDKSMEFVKKYGNDMYIVHTCHDITLKTERII